MAVENCDFLANFQNWVNSQTQRYGYLGAEAAHTGSLEGGPTTRPKIYAAHLPAFPEGTHSRLLGRLHNSEWNIPAILEITRLWLSTDVTPRNSRYHRAQGGDQ